VHLLTKAIDFHESSATGQNLNRFIRIFFFFELPDILPIMCDIQCAIDFVPSTTFPNLPHLRMNPNEHAEL
jgi:hypothetical protein